LFKEDESVPEAALLLALLLPAAFTRDKKLFCVDDVG
jgi:hypothetical protein